MVLFNYATKELTAKVVYYGPGLCGKTTNLQYIYDTLPGQAKGKMLSLATKTDRTLFFDFLPIDLGKIRGMKTKIQLYTVPGQVFYDTTRKLVLKGADGVVFVADSQSAMLEANKDSFQNLITNLREQNIEIKNMPHVIQYNKRDMKNVMDLPDLEREVNIYGVPSFEGVAVKGVGVFETLKGISKVVLKALSAKYGLEEEQQALADDKPSPKQVNVPKAPPNPAPPPKPAEEVKTKEMDEIDFIEDEQEDGLLEVDEQETTAKADKKLERISSIDDSEVIELDDVDPLEIEEMDDMAEIAKMAKDDKSETAKPASPKAVTDMNVEPISVPVSVSLPASLAGKPLRLQIDITYEE
jgi:signal recognition particle receptor subunit beta